MTAIETRPAQTLTNSYNPMLERREACEDKPWGAFGQILLVRELDGINGGKIKKIAAVSMAYPDGITGQMEIDILNETLSINSPMIYEWHGMEEGMLRAISRKLPDNNIDLTILDSFVNISGEVMKKHSRQDSQYVQDFFALQENRKDFLPRLKGFVRAILESPSFLKIASGSPRYKEEFKKKGIYILEFYMNEEGELYGIDPNGEVKPLISVASDMPHYEWLLWLKETAGKPGSRLIGHADDTETVSDCGGCSVFFDEMENDPFNKVFDLATGQIVDRVLDPFFRYSKDENETCSTCNKEKKDCTGHES